MVQSKNGQLRSPTSENSDGVSQDTQNETYTYYTDFNSAHPKRKGRGSFIKTDSKPKDMPAANLQTGFKRLKVQSELQTSEDRQVSRRHFSPNSNQSKKSNSESEDYMKRSLPNANTFSRGPERNKRHLDSEKTETNRSPQGILKPVDNIEMSQESSSSSASQSLLPVPKVSPGDKRDFIVISSGDTGCLRSDSSDPQELAEKNSGERNAADTQVYLISSSSEEMVLSQERDLSHQPLQESRTQQPNMKASKSQVSSSLVSQVHPDLPSKDKQTDGKVELANDILAEVTSEEEEGESNDTSSIGDSAGQQLLSYVIEESDVEEDEDKASDVLSTTSTQSFTQFDAILEDCHVKQQVVSEKKSHLPKLERHLRPENTRLCVVKIQRDEALDAQLNNNSDSTYS
ncbi:uncharacterized protein LOC106182037 [Lingula anatina]|uniref:Uncharacterized protein LOC106182037 n=1 Tax=Lingula anatina TaxID=7574 RepID=A0A1S3KHZ4_LINAN|nr:uncharacterized protein LOC106182037 [Lingula anatina]|eukprot:XP_013422117.1 uncharacterized protein LOC106182037 [Lingula anatina]